MERTLKSKRGFGFAAAVFFLIYLSLDYLQSQSHRRPFTVTRERTAVAIHYAREKHSELLLRSAFFLSLFFYGCTVGCAIAACVYRISPVGTALGVITLVLAIIVPISKWPLFQ
jgi:hypothetical protein